MDSVNLKAIRANLNLTQAQASELYGMDYRRYQDIESGRCHIRTEELFKIAKIANINPEKIRVK